MRKNPDSRGLPPANGVTPKKVLLIRWKSLGDVLFTLPAFNCVRASFPNSHITYMTSREYAPLLEGFSGADAIFTVDRTRLKKFSFAALAELRSLWRGIIGAHYDLVVDFQGYGETAWLSWLTRAPQRWGQVYRPGRARAYTRAVRRIDEIHPVDEHLRFLSECGLKTEKAKNVFVLPAEKRAAAEKLFVDFGLDPNRPAVFIQPFTSSPQKNWPLEKSLELARRLRELKIQVLFGGGPADRARLGPALLEKFPVAAGTDMLTSCGLAVLCAVVVGGDTGLLHMATASGRRVIALAHAGDIHGPYGHPDWTITPPRADQPAAEIELDVVLAEIRRVIGA